MERNTVNLINTVYVSLGSNIEPETNLVKAVELLSNASLPLGTSSVYQTKPKGYTDQADFLNMAVKLKTTFEIMEFKTRVLDQIEKDLKRVRDPNNKNAPRTIDLDISLWGTKVLDYGERPWHVPDADIAKFAHVALPLAEIAPNYIHPELDKPLREIAAGFDTNDFIIRTDLDFKGSTTTSTISDK